jgi:hypothetical protein
MHIGWRERGTRHEARGRRHKAEGMRDKDEGTRHEFLCIQEVKKVLFARLVLKHIKNKTGSRIV